VSRRPLPWWATALLVLVAAVLMLSPGQGRQAESLGSRIFAPVQLGVSGVFDRVADFFTTLGRVGQLAEEVRTLTEQNEQLRSEIVDLHELEAENDDLRNLLGLRQRNPSTKLVPVRVIGRDPSPFVQSITVDRGTDDGVAKDMVVVTWRGLVGRVIQADPTSSNVLLVTDVNSSVSARIQDPESRATGVVRGLSDGSLLMEHVPQQDTLVTEQLVITSGLGGIYPEGLEIGKIVRVQRKDVEVFQEAVVEPAVDVTKLERLYVMVSPPNPEAR
jgi:rod shape-determining protein MreC